MGLVNVKCPNCGAEIQLDSSREEGFCSYCGSKVIIQEAINKVKIDKSGDIQNYLQLADHASKNKNYEECMTYAKKALEVDASNCRAWIYVMISEDCMGSYDNHFRISEFQTAGLRAVASAKGSKDLLNEIYSLFLSKSKNTIQYCNKRARNVELLTIESEHEKHEYVWQIDKPFITNIDLISRKAIDLKNCVPVDFIIDNDVFCRIVRDIAETYVAFSEGINDRLNIYGHHLADSAVSARKEIYDVIKKGLPEELFANIDVSRINNNQRIQETPEQKSQGCYVATAVYGSYDCPEVWTLRRFRDYTLDETWYGRLFIKVYYATSPIFVKHIGSSKMFKSQGKKFFDRLVYKLNCKGYDCTPYKDKY